MHGAGRQGEVGCSEMLRGFDSHQYENRVNCGTRKVNRYSGIRTLDRIGLADLSVWTLCVCCCSCISGRRCMDRSGLHVQSYSPAEAVRRGCSMRSPKLLLGSKPRLSAVEPCGPRSVIWLFDVGPCSVPAPLLQMCPQTQFFCRNLRRRGINVNTTPPSPPPPEDVALLRNAKR